MAGTAGRCNIRGCAELSITFTLGRPNACCWCRSAASPAAAGLMLRARPFEAKNAGPRTAALTYKLSSLVRVRVLSPELPVLPLPPPPPPCRRLCLRWVLDSAVAAWSSCRMVSCHTRDWWAVFITNRRASAQLRGRCHCAAQNKSCFNDLIDRMCESQVQCARQSCNADPIRSKPSKKQPAAHAAALRKHGNSANRRKRRVRSPRARRR